MKERFAPKYRTDIRKREDIYHGNTKPMPADSNTISCFTDGSKTEYGTGAGYSIMGAIKTTQKKN